MLNQIKLVYKPFGQRNIDSALEFCPRPARKETNVPLKYEFFRKLFLSSKLESPVIKTLERHFFTLSECLFNVLITGESNLDERNGQLIGGPFLKK